MKKGKEKKKKKKITSFSYKHDDIKNRKNIGEETN